jgi:hypothetical protein
LTLNEIEYMYWDLITEEDEVDYTNDEQLTYSLFDADHIELYVDDFYIGKCQIWNDNEMDNRNYITLNYNIIYLDTIKLI